MGGISLENPERETRYGRECDGGYLHFPFPVGEAMPLTFNMLSGS